MNRSEAMYLIFSGAVLAGTLTHAIYSREIVPIVAAPLAGIATGMSIVLPHARQAIDGWRRTLALVNRPAQP